MRNSLSNNTIHYSNIKVVKPISMAVKKANAPFPFLSIFPAVPSNVALDSVGLAAPLNMGAVSLALGAGNAAVGVPFKLRTLK